MQPVPHPDTWFTTWLAEQKLLTPDVVTVYRFQLDEELRNRPLLDMDPPTLGKLLERDGLLTKEQRETGEREAARRQGEFMSWRSQTLRDQHPRPQPPQA